MTLEAIHLNAREAVTTFAKLSRRVDPHESTIVVARCVATDTFDKTVLLGANSPLHGVVALMQKKFHMIAAHHVGGLNTLLAFRLGER